MGMKKLLLFVAVWVVSSVATFAQSDVTTFLGIPVDGYKSDMIQALKSKGFVSSSYDKNILQGEFNGTDVSIHLATNNNKVYRLMLCDENTIDELAIRLRFNKLCDQFVANGRYVTLGEYKIPEDEDISYQMSVHKKRYEAIFYQAPNITDTLALQNNVKAMLLTKYTEEQIANPTEEIQKDMVSMALDYSMKLVAMKPVWFMISEYGGKYYITMYYDNEYNRANGEDL